MTFPSFVPEALARLPQWLYWQHEVTESGRLTKVPYQIDNWKRLAASTRPEEWATLEDARTNFPHADREGVGFVFARDGEFFGIDLDDIEKIAPEDQDTAIRLRMMIREHFPTYREVSPSGTGAHYIGRGRLPPEIGAIKDSKYGVEIYDKDRFFTFTGRVIDNMTEVVDCQQALTELAQTMRGSAVAARAAFAGEHDPRSVDEIIAAITGWANGAEFVRLMHDPLAVTLGRYHNDHSNADFAVTNFIATATKDADKAVEIFRRSPLWREGGKGGYKPEQKYIDDYLVRVCFGKVWGERALKEHNQAVAAAEGETIGQAMIEAMNERRTVGLDPVNEKPLETWVKNTNADAGAYARRFGIDLPHLNPADVQAHYPPGVMGQFMRELASGCATPVPEFVLAAGLAFLSGLTGRAYRYRGQGLNAFFMVGAKSATGKTQSILALQKMLHSLELPQLADRAYTVSGKTVQGMQSYFERFPAGGWITDECGAQIKALTEPSSQNDHELKDTINSLFDAAQPGKKWRPPISVRSNREDKTITSLSVGIGWFTTREKIYHALNDAEIADGFLSRFTPLFYNGVMGDDNDNVQDEFSDHMKKVLGTLWSIVLENDMHMPLDGVANTSKTVKVGIQPDAEAAFKLFGSETRNLTRRAQNENDDMPDHFIAMARVGITAQRLAAVASVMDNPVMPTITMDHVRWAIQFVGSRMLHVLELIATGEVGSDDSVEVPTIARVMKRLMLKHGAKVPSWALHDKLRLVMPFKVSRIGAMNAVKQAVNNLVEEGRLNRGTETGQPGRPLMYYTVTADPIWKID